MEWIKTILAGVKVAEDGKINVDEVMGSIEKEFPKHAVTKADFNNKVTELKKATDTIETLRKDTEGNEDLQKRITDYESELDTLKKATAAEKKGYALKDVLRAKGCTDPEYLIYKHGGVEKFTFDKDGKPVGVDELVTTYKESVPHVFKTEQQQRYNPLGGSGGGAVNPFDAKTFNLTEQGKLLKENPAQAKEMAAAAGMTI